MGALEIIVGSIVLLMSVIMIIVIIFQEGHDAGLGTITGGADSFMKRGKAKTADALFAKITKFCAIAFFLFVILLNSISFFGWGKDKDDDKSSSDTPVIEISSEETSAAETSETETSAAETSETETSAAETSKTETSAAETSAAETSTTESSAAETSAAETSTTETSAA